MFASGVTADEAFEMLRDVSRQSNRTLRDVARDVAEGPLPLGEHGIAG